MRANLEAFERRRLQPRMLPGNAERDPSVEVLGTPSPVPFFLAPIGVLSIAHPDGEVAAARAAASMRIPFMLSSAASHSIEEIAGGHGRRAAVVPALLGERPRDLRELRATRGGGRLRARSSSRSTR